MPTSATCAPEITNPKIERVRQWMREQAAKAAGDRQRFRFLMRHGGRTYKGVAAAPDREALSASLLKFYPGAELEISPLA